MKTFRRWKAPTTNFHQRRGCDVGARVVIPAWWLFYCEIFWPFVHRTKKGGGGGRFSEDHEHKRQFIVFVRKLLLGMMFYLMMDKACEKLFGCAVREKRILKTKYQVRIQPPAANLFLVFGLIYSRCVRAEKTQDRCPPFTQNERIVA